MDSEVMREAEKTERKPGKVGNFFFCLGVVVAMVLLQFVVVVAGMIPVAVKIYLENKDSMTVYMEKYTEYISTSSLMTYLELIYVIVGITVAGIWYYFGYVRKAKKAGCYRSVWPALKRGKSVLFLLMGSLACFSVAALLQVGISLLFPGTAQALEENMDLMLGGDAFIGMMAVVLLAPIHEELVMRGIILQHSKRVHGIVGCMILSALLFGLFHMNIIQGVYVLPMGLFWAYVGYRYNSVVPCMICHMLNNLLGTVIGSLLDPFEYVIVYALMAVVFGAVTAVIARKMEWKSAY